MRLYKAVLDNNYDVLSYEEISSKEQIFSRNNHQTFEVDNAVLREYLEIIGYITTYKCVDNMNEFIMYLDVDYKFHTIWDNDTSIHVMEQIKRTMREELWHSVKENNYDEVKKFIQVYPGIIGEKEIQIGDISYLYHKCLGGQWGSSNTDVIEIDRHSGTIKAHSVGKCMITYVVDTGEGMTTCFFDITVKK